MTLFSILIANYNNGRFFKACYESIVVQSWTNWEVVIVDDGSTDDSAVVIKELTHDDSRFRYYENGQNRGCGFTKRRCAEMAKGDLCGFLDPDDVIDPRALECMVQAHSSNGHVLVYSNCLLCAPDLQPYNVYPRGIQVDSSDPYFFNIDYPVLAFCSFKRSAYLATEGIDAYMRRAVDQDLYLKLAEQGSFHFIPDVLYHYRMHNLGISVSNEERSQFWHWLAIIAAAKRRNIDIEQIFKKHYVSRTKFSELENRLNDRLAKRIKFFFYSRYIYFKKKSGFLEKQNKHN